MVCAGYDFTIGIKSNGHIIIASSRDTVAELQGEGNCLSMSALFDHAVGWFRHTGAIAAGNNECGQCDFTDSPWRQLKVARF